MDTEVKQMARQAASGQLGLPPQYPLGEWTSESEGESIKDAFRSTSSKERLRFHQWNTEEGRLRADSGIGDHCLLCDRSEENDLEVALKRSVVPESQRTDAVWRLDSLFPSFPSRNQIFPCCSLQNSTAVEEEDLEITQDICSQEDDLETFQEICGREECPTDAEQRGKLFPHCGTEAKHLHGKAPGEDLFTPAARSLIDIQDLSSIICEDTFKATPYETPRSSHSPMDASTPLSPGNR
ncbi:inactive serine/threonine-protein kinase TEX14-like [Lacerta agilis]|uniref:inactive serine/threonine-protein kinase TEX14-like n=1 Tax=Lacerta agilis TaxID=80427 RepID=UPI00141A2038|nr:inactive serine/threonine-protein kinase TEX14-like [Lacerta agilis]